MYPDLPVNPSTRRPTAATAWLLAWTHPRSSSPTTAEERMLAIEEDILRLVTVVNLTLAGVRQPPATLDAKPNVQRTTAGALLPVARAFLSRDELTTHLLGLHRSYPDDFD